MDLSYAEIAEILKVIDASSCDELIVETEGTKLVVRRNSVAATSSAAPLAAATAPSIAAAGRQTADAPTAMTAVTKSSHQIEVAAPMVGTFYRTPSPDVAAFVEIGSTIRKGDTLCLIEVMKLFTTIASEYDGRIVQIGAENGDLVEYGQTLFVIEPS